MGQRLEKSNRLGAMLSWNNLLGTSSQINSFVKNFPPIISALDSFLSVPSSGVQLPLKIKEIYFHINFCGKQKIKSLNRDFRQKDKVTDVLSFPVHHSLRKGKSSPLDFTEVMEMGDIFICMDVASRQAKEFNLSLQQELIHLLVHGWLHLCGFDHEISAKEEKIMQLKEDFLVDKIYKGLNF